MLFGWNIDFQEGYLDICESLKLINLSTEEINYIFKDECLVCLLPTNENYIFITKISGNETPECIHLSLKSALLFLNDFDNSTEQCKEST